jgi:hypothetical protein
MLLHHILGGKGEDYEGLWFETLPAYTIAISLVFDLSQWGLYILKDN